jgi:hypothetical protein
MGLSRGRPPAILSENAPGGERYGRATPRSILFMTSSRPGRRISLAPRPADIGIIVDPPERDRKQEAGR